MLDTLPPHSKRADAMRAEHACDVDVQHHATLPQHTAGAFCCAIDRHILFNELNLLTTEAQWYHDRFDILTLIEPDCEAALEQRLHDIHRECAALRNVLGLTGQAQKTGEAPSVMHAGAACVSHSLWSSRVPSPSTFG